MRLPQSFATPLRCRGAQQFTGCHWNQDLGTERLMSSGCRWRAWPCCLRRFRRRRHRTVRTATGRFMLEAGIVGDDRCPGLYVGINGRVAGPVSLYGMVDDLPVRRQRRERHLPSSGRVAEPDRRLEVLLGRSGWLVRPALRAGIQYDGSDYVESTAGASLTFGRRYEARFILHVDEPGERFQMGGYISF